MKIKEMLTMIGSLETVSVIKEVDFLYKEIYLGNKEEMPKKCQDLEVKQISAVAKEIYKSEDLITLEILVK
jgi:hypothetical protein